MADDEFFSELRLRLCDERTLAITPPKEASEKTREVLLREFAASTEKSKRRQHWIETSYAVSIAICSLLWLAQNLTSL